MLSILLKDSILSRIFYIQIFNKGLSSRMICNRQPNKRLRPTHFVAVQVDNHEIVKSITNIQQEMQLCWKQSRNVVVPVTTLHMTLAVVHLPDEEKISRMCQVIRDSVTEHLLHSHNIVPSPSSSETAWHLEVSGLGTFNGSVLFAKAIENSAMQHVRSISDIIRQKLDKLNIHNSDHRAFNPHITIAKSRSRNLRIPFYSFKKHANKTLGRHKISSIQLCSMNSSKVNGYYQIVDEVSLTN